MLCTLLVLTVYTTNGLTLFVLGLHVGLHNNQDATRAERESI